MEKNEFTHDLFTQITSQVKNYINNHQGPHYAAFDADGTLWDNDLGENFFQYQIDNLDLPTLRNINPWSYYNSLKNKDPREAYLWLAQICANQPLSTIDTWAQLAIKNQSLGEFNSQKKLINWLLSQGIEVFIVTASVQWAVKPAAEIVGIPEKNVIGIQTKQTEGLITVHQEGPLTWRQGKATALLSRTNDIKPVFCCGNTYGDIALLESAHIQLAVQTQIEENDLYEEERRLLSYAKEKNWLCHHFFN